jgi:hypothetical protein
MAVSIKVVENPYQLSEEAIELTIHHLIGALHQPNCFIKRKPYLIKDNNESALLK